MKTLQQELVHIHFVLNTKLNCFYLTERYPIDMLRLLGSIHESNLKREILIILVYKLLLNEVASLSIFYIYQLYI